MTKSLVLFFFVIFQIILDLVSTKRQLVYHNDLISFVPTTVHKANSTSANNTLMRPPFTKHASIDSCTRKKKGESNLGTFSSSNSSSKQTYHLILFSDLMLLTIKET